MEYLVVLCIMINAVTSSLHKDNDKKDDHKKKMIEKIGCPFMNSKQLLLDNVCQMPGYHDTEPPENTEDGNTEIYFEFYSEPQILEMDEKKNKITILIHQYIKWEDPEVKARFCSIGESIKFPHDKISMIWYPDLITITEGIQHWKSLYDTMYSDIGLVFDSNPKNGHNSTMLYAYKDWEVTVSCPFNFTLFPFDIQNCHFRQYSDLDFVNFLLLKSSNDQDGWNNEALGFEIAIDIVGTFTNSLNNLETNATKNFGFDLTLKRLIQPYLFQYYLPAMAIVTVSQVSFVIPLSAIPGRVALVVTQFLTLNNIFIHQMVS